MRPGSTARRGVYTRQGTGSRYLLVMVVNSQNDDLVKELDFASLILPIVQVREPYVSSTCRKITKQRNTIESTYTSCD